MTREERAFQLLLVCPVGADCIELDNLARVPVHEKIVGRPRPADPLQHSLWAFDVIAAYKMAWVQAMLEEFEVHYG